MKIKEMLKQDMSKIIGVGTLIYTIVILACVYGFVVEKMILGVLILGVWFFGYVFFLPTYTILFITYVYITKQKTPSFIETILIGFLSSLIIIGCFAIYYLTGISN